MAAIIAGGNTSHAAHDLCDSAPPPPVPTVASSDHEHPEEPIMKTQTRIDELFESILTFTMGAGSICCTMLILFNL
jgi:hypothetical protein